MEDYGSELNRDIARQEKHIRIAYRHLEAEYEELARLRAEKRAFQQECNSCGDCSMCLG